MANPEHVEILMQGVEVWNKWREENPEIKPDLRRLFINPREFKDILLYTGTASEVDLRDVNFSNTDLTDTKIEKANAAGAIFDCAELVNTRFDEVNLFKTSFKGATLHNANLAGAYLDDASFVGAKVTNADLTNIKATRADFSKAHLSKMDLSGSHLPVSCFVEAAGFGCIFKNTYLAGTNFRKAKFEGSDFSGAALMTSRMQESDFRTCDFSNADVRHAYLSGADIRYACFQGCSVSDILFNRLTRCQGVRVDTCYGSQLFKSYAQDQDYLEEYREKHPILYRLWFVFADCGRSFWPWASWSVLFALVFAALYFYALGPESFHINGDLPPTFLTMTYYSVVTFTTLGFGDLTPATTTAAVFVMIEVVLGYIMLGGLISILANKLARRA